MTYPAAPDPLLPEPGAPAALEYRPANTERPRHSRLGVTALAAALLSPMTLLASIGMFSAGMRPPPLGFRAVLALVMFGGPVAGLALGTTALISCRIPRHRRWPAVVAVTLSGAMLALLAAALFIVGR